MTNKKKLVSKKKADNKKIPFSSLLTGGLFLLIFILASIFSWRVFNIDNRAVLENNNASQAETSFFKEALSPLGLSASLAAGGQKLTFFWTLNNTSTKFYRLYHGVSSGVYSESYDSQDLASSLEIDISNFSPKEHFFALSAIGFNGVESSKSAELKIDLSRIGECGNGLIEKNMKDANGDDIADEVCDGNAKIALTLSSDGYRQVFNCLSDCTGWSETATKIEFCGDGIVNGNEKCEGNLSFPCASNLYSGISQCDPTSCTLGLCNIGTQLCGNGILEGLEQCETGAAPIACSWFGFPGTKTCSAWTCLWGNCISPSACGVNNGNNFVDLNSYDPDNCASGKVKNFTPLSASWTWQCEGSPGVSNCTATKKTNGSCGNAVNIAQYSQPTQNLCSIGLATTPSYNTAVHKFTWTCPGTGGGDSASCSAPKCGDGFTISPESCDFGLGKNNDTSGCKADCKFGSYRHTCPSLPDPDKHVYNLVHYYNIPCIGANAAGNACGSFAFAPDLQTEYNLASSNLACRYKCALGWGKCGNDISCQTNLRTTLNCGSCGHKCNSSEICGTNGECLSSCGNGSVEVGEECDFGAEINETGVGCTEECAFGFVSKDCRVSSIPHSTRCNNTYQAKCTGQNGQTCSTWDDPTYVHTSDCKMSNSSACGYRCKSGHYNCNNNDDDGCESPNPCP